MNFILTDFPKTKKNLLPLTFFRPVADLLCGILTLKQKWEYFLKQKTSYLTDDYLQEKFLVEYAETNLYINSSIFPNEDLIKAIFNLNNNEKLIKNDVIIAIKTSKKSIKELIQSDYKLVNYSKKIDGIFNTYDIFNKNAKQIITDFDIVTKNKKSFEPSKTNIVLGKNPVFLEEGVVAEACIFNTDEGAIYIGKNVKILEGSILRGPLAILDNSVIKMGAKIYGGTTIGKNCKIGGEVKEVVFLGNSNKGHDGYLGNSVIGEWCNLGANTNNSNLKNNYSNVKLWNYAEQDFIDTGLQFCGLIMGDHSKTGIATMFNTGTVVGVSSNIFGSDFQPKFFPSFKWGNSLKMDNYRFEKAKEVARIVMKRRNIKFEGVEERLFESVYLEVRS